MAFLSVNRSNGIKYIYLREYTPQEDYIERTSRLVYSFGRIEKALPMLKKWHKHFEILFPEDLKEHGFSKKDLLEWIEQLETGRTPRGKKMSV